MKWHHVEMICNFDDVIHHHMTSHANPRSLQLELPKLKVISTYSTATGKIFQMK